MKKSFLTFLLLLMTFGFISAQATYNVTVCGTVIDSSGNPVVGVPVVIVFDSTMAGGGFWAHTDSTVTDSTGSYCFVAAVPSFITVGIFNVTICNTFMGSITGTYTNTPAGSTIMLTALTACGSTGGGGGGGGGTNLSISGFIYAGPGGPFLPGTDDAIVYLIVHDTVLGTLTAMDTTETDSGGFYYFDSLMAGDYLVKAALLPASPVYSSHVPTYYTNSLHWSFATTISISNASASAVNISLISAANPGGPGFVGGLISAGANKTAGPGAPEVGVEVLIMDMLDNPIQYTYTDANGEFNFTNLAYGTYKIYPEVLDKTTTPMIVTLSALNPGAQDLNFHVNTTDVITRIAAPAAPAFELQVFPNPVADAATVAFELKQGEQADIQLMNLQGQQVGNWNSVANGKQELKLDMESLPKGMYLLKVRIDNSEVVSKLLKY